MNSELIFKTEEFLKTTFENSEFLKAHPEEAAYRLEHTYRVANIGKQIAKAEGLDVTATVIACLLHDISYCNEMQSREERMAHGRSSAQIARPFIGTLGLPEDIVNDILYGVAIHVDGESDFEWRNSTIAETVSDADNIDRFDVYRIYETLEYKKFSKMPFAEKLKTVTETLEKLKKFRDMKFATKTAVALWQQRIDYYLSFYSSLLAQLEASTSIK